MPEEEKCPIWGCHENPYCRSSREGEGGSTIQVSCARAGGNYRFAKTDRDRIADLSESAKVCLSAWVARENLVRADDGHIPTVDENILRRIETQAIPSVPERLDFALEWLVRKSTLIGAAPLCYHRGKLGEREHHRSLGSFAAFSYIRSDVGELRHLFPFLLELGVVKCGRGHFSDARVTAKGYARYEELRRTVDSSQAFVAMWFDESMAPLREAIEAAVRAAGYEPKCVDTDPEVIGRIEDEIIALIRQSRFVVADFTASPVPIRSDREANPRGGVYYEAGFAHGLNRPVFFTCRKDYISTPKALHFDTSHFLHLDWEEGDLGEGGKFREELRERIKAVVGEGPKTAPDGD